jgi:hypothetical protein
MQQIASGLNKSKRQSFLMLRKLIGIAEIVWQVTTCRKIFPSGYHHLILGRITMTPANHATLGLGRGSFRVTRSQNGKCLKPGVPFYGSMGNVC